MSKSNQNSQSKTIVSTGLILFAITAVAALALAIVNSITAPIIETNNIAKTKASMTSVMTNAKDFISVELSDQIDKLVTDIYEAKDESGNTIGACICVSPNGYGGAIDMVVGVDTDGKVTGVDIVNQSETAGLGSNATKPEFKDQYIGKKEINKVVKSGASDDEINAISSATITSKAVTNGVNIAIETANNVLAKEGK